MNNWKNDILIFLSISGSIGVFLLLVTCYGLWMTSQMDGTCVSRHGHGSRYAGATYSVPGRVIDKYWCYNQVGRKVPM